jgi:RimJ/RimL family protein N-acetyltransferase
MVGQSALISAPRLETERLILRAFAKADFDAHMAIMARPEVTRFLGPRLSREDLWRRIVSSVGMWTVVGFGGWMVETKADGRLVGNAGLFDARRDLLPDFGGEPEMGWIFDPSVHSQGIAREACDAVLAWAGRNLPPTPVWAIISPGNDASFRLAERLGFERLDDSVYHDEPIAILRRPARA